MGFTQTIKNIWSVEDLRRRIGITLLLVIIYRFGCYVVLPGINPDELMALKNFTSDGLMQLLDMFSGGAFSQASIFALGIMPYITASIVIQLLGMVLPAFQKMQREGESGRMKLNQYTRYLTVLILLLQGPAYLMNLKYQVQAAGGHVEMGFWTVVFMTIVLAAGSMFIMWLGERIDQKGIGNGISFIILIGIMARFPEAVIQEFTGRLMTPPAWSCDLPCGACNPRSRHSRCCASRAGHTQGARAVCKAHTGQQAVWRCASVHSSESERSRCDADHLCAGNHVHPCHTCWLQHRADRILRSSYRPLWILV